MNLVEEAETLLLHQFKDSKKLKGLVRGLTEPFQEALTHLEKINRGRYIDEATGYTLDIIGDILDFPRDDMNDEEYRIWLTVAVLLNNGHGTAKSVFDILRVLFGTTPDIQIDEYRPNVVMFTFFKYPDVPTKILFSILRRAMPLGSECQFVDASPAANKEKTSTLSSPNDREQHCPTFQLDVTGFDQSIFADFFEKEKR